MKASIITISLNSKSTIEDTIKSVLSQNHKEIEYIIIDGGSTDGTIDIIKKYEEKISSWISEPDYGIFDAMNKGIKKASGEVVGILNSNDIYYDESVIDEVLKTMSESSVETCYGDLVYVEEKNTDKVVRYWRSSKFAKKKFKRGWMPPHPTFFVKKEVYEKYGMFNTDFSISADYELMLRFLYKNNVSATYIPRILVKMRAGGNSSPGLKNTIEDYKTWKINDLNPNMITFILKPLSKIPQYFLRPH